MRRQFLTPALSMMILKLLVMFYIVKDYTRQIEIIPIAGIFEDWFVPQIVNDVVESVLFVHKIAPSNTSLAVSHR